MALVAKASNEEYTKLGKSKVLLCYHQLCILNLDSFTNLYPQQRHQSISKVARYTQITSQVARYAPARQWTTHLS